MLLMQVWEQGGCLNRHSFTSEKYVGGEVVLVQRSSLKLTYISVV